MKRLPCPALFAVLLALSGSGVFAHYNMLLPESLGLKRGEPIRVIYQWGHPFEHQLFNAPTPEGVALVNPEGKKTDLTSIIEKLEADEKTRLPVRFRISFTPESRGDYLLLLHTPPIWMEEDQEFLQDTVKVVVHVQAQKGWDRRADEEFEVVPLTRPYGLTAGAVFQAQVLSKGKPLAGSLVEIEHYNSAPPAALPADEFITRTAKTDPNGIVTCSLTEAGWWCLTGSREGGTREHTGKRYPVRQRTSFWVHVD